MERAKKMLQFPAKPHQNGIVDKLVQKIKAMFKPEEVEIEFSNDGDYSYTVVEDKRVA